MTDIVILDDVPDEQKLRAALEAQFQKDIRDAAQEKLARMIIPMILDGILKSGRCDLNLLAAAGLIARDCDV